MYPLGRIGSSEAFELIFEPCRLAKRNYLQKEHVFQLKQNKNQISNLKTSEDSWLKQRVKPAQG